MMRTASGSASSEALLPETSNEELLWDGEGATDMVAKARCTPAAFRRPVAVATRAAGRLRLPGDLLVESLDLGADNFALSEVACC